MAPSVLGILLAAGRSRRFGADKRLAPWIDGQALVVHSARALAAAADRTLVVIRADDAAVAGALAAAGFDVLACPDADLGMGHSLAFAIRHALQQPELQDSAVLLALADMPAIAASSYMQVSAALRAGVPLVRPRYGVRAGHPVGFGRSELAALTALEGDAGARQLLVDAAARCQFLQVEDPGVLLDIDTPEDLAAF